MTSAVGGVAGLAVRRSLRGSAEVFAVLFGILVAVDFLAAHFGDLAGLGSLSWTALGWTTATLLLAAGAAWAIIGARSRLTALVGAAFLARAASLRVTAAGSLLLAVLCFAVAAVTSLSRLVAADTVRELWLGNGAYGWLICCALVGAVALARPLPVPARIAAAAAALAGLTAVVVRPAAEASPSVSAGFFTAAALLLAVCWALRRGIWGQGARIAAVLPALVAARLVALPVAVVVAKCLSAAATPWTLTAYARPGTLGLYSAMSPLVTVGILAGLAVVAELLVTARLPSVPSAVVVAASAAAVGALGYDLPLAAIVVVLVALAVLAAAAARWRPQPPSAAVFPGSVLLALLAAAGSVGLTAFATAVLGAVFAALAATANRSQDADGEAAVAVGLLAAFVAADVQLLGGDVAVRGVGVVAVGAVVLLVTQALIRVQRTAPRTGLEVGAVVAAVAGLGLAQGNSTLLAVALSISGGGAVLTALLSADRRWLSVPGGLLLAAASWVRLADADIDVVEAYTLPEALVLLAVGAWRLRAQPRIGSVRTLLPGLSLALVPSLVRSLDAPTSLRALVLGLCGLGVLLFGAYRRLIAPLAAGAVVVAVLALLNLAPYAAALPRWVLFACVGAGLLFLGTTWERRLADLRRVGQSAVRFG